tara:strand:- start:4380 stop:4784 length:405 start_codon:yes stop_codon:yes gene_type:complete
MAYGGKNISLNDLDKNSYIGFGFPFNVPGVFRQTDMSKDAIKANLLNFFLTNPGERYMNSEFGGGLRQFIFEQLQNNTIDSVKGFIISKLGQFFPNIKVRKLEAIPDYNRNQITIKFSYFISNTGESDRVFITL